MPRMLSSLGNIVLYDYARDGVRSEWMCFGLWWLCTHMRGKSDVCYSCMYADEYIRGVPNLQYGSVGIGGDATPVSARTNTCALMRWWSITLVTDTCISLPPDLTPTMWSGCHWPCQSQTHYLGTVSGVTNPEA